MTLILRKPGRTATPIHLTDRAGLSGVLKSLPAAQQRWAEQAGFTGAADTHLLVPDAQGGLSTVLAGVSIGSRTRRSD